MVIVKFGALHQVKRNKPLVPRHISHYEVIFHTQGVFHESAKIYFVKKATLVIDKCGFSGAPEETRTPDLLIRSQTLYPAELPAHMRPFISRK